MEPPPPFKLHAPDEQTAPVVFASAHSGRDYPAAFLAATRLDPLALRRSEDSFVDELFASAPGAGAPLLAANFPRAFCDPNREAWELDPAMFEGALPAWVNTGSVRVHAGLGTIARVVGAGEPIYRGKLRFAEAEQRVQACWRPWHAELDRLVQATRARFGCCLLVDCHSMPGRPRQAEIVLGDAHGTSCRQDVTRAVDTLLAGQGYRVARNDPYAGGYITRHYGRPHRGVHALQIEIARGLYMDEARIERSSGFRRLQDDIAGLVRMLAEAAGGLMSNQEPGAPPVDSAGAVGPRPPIPATL